ncbi:MAG: lysozyme inhibitor LprI family protein [Neisseria sp.]|nr:lysozyme inhibitor LprI family protein [Neisseria sp.]
MSPKSAALPAAIALLLGACGEKEAAPPPALACADPAVVQNIRNSLQQTVREQARAFAVQDVRQFVDADKVVAATVSLNIALENPAQDGGTHPYCRADLSIGIPEPYLKTAEANTPLLYAETTLDQFIRQRTQNGSLRYLGRGIFAQSLKYIPERRADGGLDIRYTDNSLSVTADTLTAVLLPYGVKSLLMIDGKAVSLEDALKRLNGGAEPEEEAASEVPASQPAQTPASAEEVKEGQAASTPEAEGKRKDKEAAGDEREEKQDKGDKDKSDEEEKPGKKEGKEEKASDAKAEKAESEVSDADLSQSRADNRAANREIAELWRGLDKTVQEGLVDEQSAWIKKKTADCRKAAAKGKNEADAEYRRLECDTRKTRERILYLHDYTI